MPGLLLKLDALKVHSFFFVCWILESKVAGGELMSMGCSIGSNFRPFLACMFSFGDFVPINVLMKFGGSWCTTSIRGFSSIIKDVI